MNAASQFGSARRSEGSQSRPSATGTTPTRKPDQAVAEEPARRGGRRLDRRRDLLHGLDAGRARDADRDRVVLDPVVGHDDRARAQPLQRRRPVERERDDRVVDGDRRDRQLLGLRVAHPDPDLARAGTRRGRCRTRQRPAGSADQVDERRRRGRRTRRRRARAARSARAPRAATRARSGESRPASISRRRRSSPSSRAR